MVGDVCSSSMSMLGCLDGAHTIWGFFSCYIYPVLGYQDI